MAAAAAAAAAEGRTVLSVHQILSNHWPLYFPQTPIFAEDDTRVLVIRAFAQFLNNEGRPLWREAVLRDEHSIQFDYQSLVSLCPLADLPVAVRDHPEDTIACLGLALCVLRSKIVGMETCTRMLHVRLYNLQPLTPLEEIKSHFIGKMIAVRGNVVRVSAVRPHVMRMDFVCGKCGSMAPRSMPEGRYEPPTKCVVPSCKGKFFTPERASAVTVDWQKLKIQEVEADQMDAGRIPRTLEVEVQGDLVDSCVPGDVVHVTGVVKAVHAEDTRLGRSKSLYLLFLQANWVSSPRRQPSASTRAAVSRGLAEEGGRAAAVEEEVGQLDTVEFSRRDMIAIQDIASQPALLELVVASLCPAIFGHEEVKLGLTLALFGGTRHGARGSGGTRTLAVRGDPHVLVVGDPGMGKSQMLQAVSALSPRGVYVCGNTTSTTGLTVTMVRDAATGEFALEAGALVLGDQGLCCIDEFDKMGAEHQALLEAMEQQSISIAKAGIVCTLSARTSVVAAANPAGGHYNRSKTVAENLRMPSPLLSRFDLIFILLDQPDVRRDQLLSEHVMALHAGSASAGGAAEDGRAHAAGLAQPASAPGGDAAGGRASLVQRLRQGSARCTDPIPAPLLRKYIAYARKYVHPALTAEAATVLRDFFLTLRRSHRDSESVPITTRQLESLIRLAQARAKLELREVVTRSDAEDVVQLLRESMLETYTDEYGCVDFSRAGGMSMSKKVKEFVGALTKVARERGSALFTVAEMAEVARASKLQVDDFHDFVEVLNHQNYVLKKGPRLYQVQTSQFSQHR